MILLFGLPIILYLTLNPSGAEFVHDDYPTPAGNEKVVFGTSLSIFHLNINKSGLNFIRSL